jgi:hypothetical protein
MSTKTLSLFPPVDDDNTSLALRPLHISGMHTPIVDADGGIDIRMAANTKGLFCRISPYLKMNEDDKLEIYWASEKILELKVMAHEVNQPVFFYVPAPKVSGLIEDCYYVLTRVGETVPDEPSVPSRFLAKLYRPGWINADPHKPEQGHSRLFPVKLPPELIEQGVIDAEWAKKGFPVTVPFYRDIAIRDSIRIYWGTFALASHLVTQQQAQELEPIVIQIDQETILSGGDSESLRVIYDVHDEVWNWADHHSQLTHIGVDAGGWRLEAPIIKQSINGIITIRDLDKQPVTVQVHVVAKDFDLGDTVTVTWIGTPPENGKPMIHTVSRTVDNIPSILELSVPYEDVRAIAMGRADASYVLHKKDGSPSQSSKRTFASVVGDVNLLPEPTIQELIGDILESDTSLATVDVRYPSMASGDLVNLIWLGELADGRPYLHEDQHTVTRNEADSGLITFYVEGRHIIILDNGQLDLSYRVSNDKTSMYAVTESERLLVKVQAVRATLPAPVVPEAENDVLDPEKVFDHVTVLIENLTKEREDILTYYWTGPFARTSDWIPITAPIVTQPIRFRVDAEYVSANIGEYVKVRYVLKHAKTGLFSYSATLNLLIGYKLGDLPPPEVDEAINGTLDPMHALTGVNVKTRYESMDSKIDLINLKWLGTPGAGTSDDQEKPGDDSGTVNFQLDPQVVGANINKTVLIDYHVKRYGRITPSQPLSLKVLDFQDPENQLPRPQIPQAVNGVLDLMEFTGNAAIRVDKWPHIAPKQCLWLRLEGKTTAGDDYVIHLLQGVQINTGQISAGLHEPLLRSELMKLGHSTPATAICKVAFDGTAQEYAAIEFPRLPVTVRTRYDYVTPVITDVSDSRGDIPEGDKTRDEQVTFKGTATRGETVELFEGASTSMGTALVGDNSVWTRQIGPLIEKTYSITAKARYDANPVSSAPRTFTVKFAQTPEILSVTDSRGLVQPGAITYDNSVLVQGSATPEQQVELRETGAAVITLNVDDKGDWSHRLNGLTVKTYTLTARALYEIDPADSPPYAFRAAQAITPTISRVSDIRGDIAPGGTTYYLSVDLTGKASPNEKVTLMDGTASIDTVDVDPAGDWTYTFTGLTLKQYHLTAKGEYGSEPVSEPRLFTVAAHIAPTLTSVVDTIGQVAQNATTYDTAVTLSGAGTPREQIQIHNKGAAVGNPLTIEANGQWSGAVSSLAITSHSMTAKALYPVTPGESAARNFTVAAHIAVTLVSVRDNLGVELQNGAQTKGTSVTLSGAVTPGRQVQIYDNGSPRTTVTGAGGSWSTALSVGLGGHSMYARAVSTGQNSVTRSFTVISPIPPLYFNTSTVTLSGKIYIYAGRDDVLPGFGPGTSVQHQASGGAPGYSYTSSNTSVAVVNGSGYVTVRGKGSAQISVRDTIGQSGSYTVNVTGAIRLLDIEGSTFGNIQNAVAQRGARMPSIGELREIHAAYGSRWPNNNAQYWSNTVHSNFIVVRYWTKSLTLGNEMGQVNHTVAARGVGLI